MAKLLEGASTTATTEMTETDSAHIVRSLDRALAILDALAATPTGLTLAELSRRVSIAKSTAHRLILTLEHRGFVVRVPESSCYVLGLKVSGTVHQAVKPHIHGILEELAARSGESTNLGVPHGSEVVYVDRVESQHALRWGLSIGSRVPIHCAAMGKAILAALPAQTRNDLLKSLSLQPLTGNTITTLDALTAQLREIQVSGYAIDDEEYMDGVRCIAMAVRRGPAVVGAISIAGPAVRFTRQVALAQRPALFHAQRMMSSLLVSADQNEVSEDGLPRNA